MTANGLSNGNSSAVKQEPLSSNHHLPAQFNQLTLGQAVAGHGHQAQASYFQDADATDSTSTAHQAPFTGYKRHSYVKIDYSQPFARQMNKLEDIDISLIRDIFPASIISRVPPDSFFLVKFWADLNDDFDYTRDDQNTRFAFTNRFETFEAYKEVTCSTFACSYGREVVQKDETRCAVYNNVNGRYSFNIDSSPMCAFMVQFIRKLRQLPAASQMDSVLDNFSIIQIVTCEATSEILLCLCYLFATASPNHSHASNYHVYKLKQGSIM